MSFSLDRAAFNGCVIYGNYGNPEDSTLPPDIDTRRGGLEVWPSEIFTLPDLEVSNDLQSLRGRPHLRRWCLSYSSLV
jgi:hypothetical protein